MLEDGTSKEYFASKYIIYKMVNARPVVEQLNKIWIGFDKTQ
jgi:hypothetical protein